MISIEKPEPELKLPETQLQLSQGAIDGDCGVTLYNVVVSRVDTW